MEQLLLDVYDAEYRRLGPSVIRYIERQVAGYLRFKDSPELLLRLRAEQHRNACLEALPLFPTAVRYAPTREVAEKVRNIGESIVSEIGGASLKNRIAAMVLPVLARISDFRGRHFAYPQPKLARSEYRMSPRILAPVDLLGEGTLKIRLRQGFEDRYHLMVELHGVFDRVTAVKLKKRIEAYLEEHSGKLALNFHGVTEIERDALLRFFKKLRGYRERIKLVNIDSLSAEAADVIAYARDYFEVFIEEECLAKSMA
jgi:anti-anti-sigma regulatory factor